MSLHLFPQEATLRTGSRDILIFPDIHADLFTLESILRSERLIHESGDWIGGDRVVLFLGDLISKGRESRGVMDLIMPLEVEAPRAGGYVEAILGNHESMVSTGDFRYVWKRDQHSFWDLRSGRRSGYEVAYQGDSIYSEWIRSRRSALRLIPDEGRSYLLVHAGVDRWLEEFSLEETNALIQAWLTYYQGKGPRPPASTEWLLDEQGPLFSRRMADPTDPENRLGPLSRSDLRFHLDRLEVDAVIAGHTPTSYLRESGGVIRQTEAYYRDFILADTGFSRFMGGRPSAIAIENGILRPIYYSRPVEMLPLTQAAQMKCAEFVREMRARKK